MTSLGNQGVQKIRKDKKIIWSEGLDSGGQQFHQLSPLISLANISLSSLALMYIKNICVCSIQVCNKL